jgi:hypothetical protein
MKGIRAIAARLMRREGRQSFIIGNDCCPVISISVSIMGQLLCGL